MSYSVSLYSWHQPYAIVRTHKWVKLRGYLDTLYRKFNKNTSSQILLQLHRRLHTECASQVLNFHLQRTWHQLKQDTLHMRAQCDLVICSSLVLRRNYVCAPWTGLAIFHLYTTYINSQYSFVFFGCAACVWLLHHPIFFLYYKI